MVETQKFLLNSQRRQGMLLESRLQKNQAQMLRHVLGFMLEL